MMSQLALPDAFRGLPAAIWMAGSPPSVYRGTPVEMVRAMADEMGQDIPVREAVAILSGALTGSPVVALRALDSDEAICAWFIRSLLASKVSRVLAAA